MTYGEAVDEFAEFKQPERQRNVIDRDLLAAALQRLLPNEKEMGALFRRLVLGMTAGVEFIEADRRMARRLWLESDTAGPGYPRQKVYGFLTVDHGDLEALAAGSVDSEQRIMAEHQRMLFDAARRVGERIATFRAVNGLTAANAVTVRCRSGLWFGYLTPIGTAGIGMKTCEDTDAYYVRMGSYFTVCPPGNEWVPPMEHAP